MKTIALGELGVWGSGGTPLSSRPEYYDGSIPWLIIEDLNDGIVSGSQKKITEIGLKNSSAKLVQPGTLLIAMYGSIGKLGVASVPCATNQAIAFCRCDPKKVDIWFLFYYLLNARNDLAVGGRGGTQQNISQTFLKDFPVNLPSPLEQKRLAAILAKADRLRRLRRYALAVSDTYLQTVFLEMFGDPISNPKGLELKEMGDEINSIRYGTGSPPPYQKDGIPFVRATNIKRGTVMDRDMVFFSSSDADKFKKCQIEEGDLIIVRSGANTGDSGLIPKRYHGAYAAYDLIVELPSPQNVYYNHIINSSFGKAIIEPLSRRAGQPHLNAEQVKELVFPSPPLPLQQKFAQIVQKYERLQAQQREAARQAEGLFQALLHRAFRGELSEAAVV